MAEYERKTKDSKPVLAICYDFDRTQNKKKLAVVKVLLLIYNEKRF